MTIRRKRRSIVATVVYEHRAYAPIVHLFVSISLARQQSRLRISFSLSGTSRVCLPADILPIYCRKSSVNHFPDITPDRSISAKHSSIERNKFSLGPKKYNLTNSESKFIIIHNFSEFIS